MSEPKKFKIAVDAECKSCSASGLYVGIGERDGGAVVCHTCKGTGLHRITLEYVEFKERRQRSDVRRVYRVNAGIMIGEAPEKGLRLEDFGGVSYADWLAGNTFPAGTEDRQHTCPAWFYQSADYSKKPDWEECGCGGSFSACKHFCDKAKCWARWDKEFTA